LADTVTSTPLLSGCISDTDDAESDSSEDDTTESSDDVFDSVDIGGSELTFALTEDADVSTNRLCDVLILN